jgi:hypothetical protein
MVGRLNSAEAPREPATIRRSEVAGGLVLLIDRFCPMSDLGPIRFVGRRGDEAAIQGARSIISTRRRSIA